MNYIKELNAFYDWLESNPSSSDAIALWQALMSVCNRAGWPKEFTVANSTLQAKAGLSRMKLDRWRGYLIDKNLIEYKKSNRVNEAGKYKINFLCVQNDTQNDTRNDTQDDTQNDTQDETQNGNIIKLNKTKLKKTYSSDFEQFWDTYPRKVGKKRSYSCWEARVKEESPDTLIRCAEHYAAYCHANGTEERYMKHPSTFLSAKKDYEDFIELISIQAKSGFEKPTKVVNGPIESVQVSEEERSRMDEIRKKKRSNHTGDP